MAQGQFTKQEAEATREAAIEMHAALPKTKQVDYIGHLNDVLLFLSAAGAAAPDEAEVTA